MSQTVLNPRLYARLKAISKGRVKVSNAGEAISPWPPVWDDYTGKWAFNNEGEYYLVCCPFCSDTRYRLYVNHMWGQLDPNRRPMNFMAVCFNEQRCMSKHSNLMKFIDMIEGSENFDLTKSVIKPGRKMTADDLKIIWPGPVNRIDRLPADHKAVHYVQAVRGFDVGVLGRYYGVSYCEQSVYYLATDRLILPIYHNNKMVGWQARYIGEKRSWKGCPKYWAAPRMKKSKVVGNLDNAKKFKTIVIVEGFFDVYAVGPMAGCVFGHDISAQQFKLIRSAAQLHESSVIHLLDPEVFDNPKVRDVCKQFRRALSGKFAAVKLPEGADPGSLGREFLWGYIAQHAAKQGVEVSFEKRDAPETP